MQDRKITRRSFLKKSANVGAASLVGGAMVGCRSTSKPAAVAEMSVVTGSEAAAMTREAVNLMGGMGRFVPNGARVCLLPNTQKNNPGTFTRPEIVKAVVEMCREAGAGEVNALSWIPRKGWEATGLAAAVEEAGGTLKIVDLKDESLFRPVPVPGGEKLKEARIMELFFEHDVFINLPICKDHAGNRFTGTLKNMMGLNSPKSNRTFHTGNFKNDDIEHLDQCIAELNLVLNPTLCVVDATEFIITNGPFGPGELHRPRKVVAGVDRVAVDAYCATLWELDPEEIIMIDKARKLKIGDLKAKTMKEANLS